MWSQVGLRKHTNKTSGGDRIPAELFQILKDDAVKVLQSVCQQIWPQDWKRSIFIPIPKKGNAKECSNYNTIALISHAIKSESEVAQSCPTLCDPVDCSLPGFLCPWDSPGKTTGVGYHFLLQGIFLTQGLNLCLPHCMQILYYLIPGKYIIISSTYSLEFLFREKSKVMLKILQARLQQ